MSKVTFKNAGPDALLVIRGKAGKRAHGLAVKCTVAGNEKSLWHNFASDLTHWQASGKDPVKARLDKQAAWGIDDADKASYMKIWAAQSPSKGRRRSRLGSFPRTATSVGSPYRPGKAMCVLKLPAKKFACKFGLAGACRTFFRGTTDADFKTFAEDANKPWDVTKARAFCMKQPA